MFELARQAGLGDEPQLGVGAASAARAERLERNFPPQRPVDGRVGDADSAFAEPSGHVVAMSLFSNQAVWPQFAVAVMPDSSLSATSATSNVAASSSVSCASRPVVGSLTEVG